MLGIQSLKYDLLFDINYVIYAIFHNIKLLPKLFLFPFYLMTANITTVLMIK